MSCLTMDKRQVIKPSPFANTVQGFGRLVERLEGLGVAPKQIVVGMEATSRYGENLFQALLNHGYQACLLVLVCGAKWVRGPEKPMESQQFLTEY